jgi:hypothetical protein
MVVYRFVSLAALKQQSRELGLVKMMLELMQAHHERTPVLSVAVGVLRQLSSDEGSFGPAR